MPRLREFKGVPGRMERIEEGQPFNVLVDYAHTDDALRNALGMLRAITPGRLLVVFGCGGNRDRTKRPRMVRAVQEFADFAFATADNPRGEQVEKIFADMREGVTDASKIAWIDDRRRAISLALDSAKAGDSLLIAGKGHEGYQEFADTVIPFDDRQVVRELIAREGAADLMHAFDPDSLAAWTGGRWTGRPAARARRVLGRLAPARAGAGIRRPEDRAARRARFPGRRPEGRGVGRRRRARGRRGRAGPARRRRSPGGAAGGGPRAPQEASGEPWSASPAARARPRRRSSSRSSSEGRPAGVLATEGEPQQPDRRRAHPVPARPGAPPVRGRRGGDQRPGRDAPARRDDRSRHRPGHARRARPTLRAWGASRRWRARRPCWPRSVRKGGTCVLPELLRGVPRVPVAPGVGLPRGRARRRASAAAQATRRAGSCFIGVPLRGAARRSRVAFGPSAARRGEALPRDRRHGPERGAGDLRRAADRRGQG